MRWQRLGTSNLLVIIILHKLVSLGRNITACPDNSPELGHYYLGANSSERQVKRILKKIIVWDPFFHVVRQSETLLPVACEWTGKLHDWKRVTCSQNLKNGQLTNCEQCDRYFCPFRSISYSFRYEHFCTKMTKLAILQNWGHPVPYKPCDSKF